jgi:tRNA 2-thiouridine synthesizing protein A
MSITTLDTKGLNCPLPVLRAKKAIKDVPPDGILQVLATDPGSPKDFEAFCRATGNELIETREENGVFVFSIKKVSAPA